MAHPPSQYPADDDAAQVYYDVNSGRLGIQLGSVNALDSKAAAMFSTGSAIIALVMAVAALRADHLTGWAVLPLGLALGASLVVGGLTIKATWLHGWKEFPSALDTWKVLATRTGEGRWHVARTLSQSWATNEAPLLSKTRLVRCSQFALAAETVFAVAALVVIAASPA